ncbi:adenosine deaminase [Leekyejoonella antrihumi]|uniref:Adenosine deaminase n=1 Tax=Leekyejoonella antrihumi TaxID=1660198 RepID=A0A563DY06_9MICO|nr:adenosine deaminase [Leekyejoonella antrihumi]TWP35158.1 adenosine deaminase [Leekyejoonella antrihumi]
MNYDTFLRDLPKVDLHCHLAGTMRPATMIELAQNNDVQLPTTDPDLLYAFDDFYDFLRVVRLAAECVITRADFARVAYEALSGAATSGNLRYAELFFNPTDYQRQGVDYPTMIDGYIEGLRAAETDHGVHGRLIPSINRELGPQVAEGMVREVIAHRRDEVIGIGMDGSEHHGPPEQFTQAYRLARQAGLHCTAHACEDNQTLDQAPPSNVIDCVDKLGCSRIDHGYNLLADARLVQRCQREHIPFTVGSHTCVSSRQQTRWDNLHRMRQANLSIVICTDDPPMFGTDIGQSYASVCTQLNLTTDAAAQLALDSIDATWLDDTDRHRLRSEFATTIAAMQNQPAQSTERSDAVVDANRLSTGQPAGTQ